ncbi:hypothetical protein BV392_10075 [Rhodovulum sulfidophilum]|nr:hypothetical protein BV392_10075 [Rhodovulum sulfidophilum]
MLMLALSEKLESVPGYVSGHHPADPDREAALCQMISPTATVPGAVTFSLKPTSVISRLLWSVERLQLGPIQQTSQLLSSGQMAVFALVPTLWPFTTPVNVPPVEPLIVAACAPTVIIAAIAVVARSVFITLPR